VLLAYELEAAYLHSQRPARVLVRRGQP
jgi:hypothetical protein